MLRKWLKCGYIFNKQMFPTEEGTPQGGIISPTLANMTLDGLQKVLAERYKRRTIKGEHYSPMVNLVRYADDFIITCENRETLENEIKPLVAEFMAERGLTLSEEKTVITNIRDGFDFLGFNIRKYGNEILTKPTKKAEKRFMENIRKVIKGNKGCKQESLIRMLNAKSEVGELIISMVQRVILFTELTIKYSSPYGNGLNVAIPRKGSDGLKTVIGITSEVIVGHLLPSSRSQMGRMTS